MSEFAQFLPSDVARNFDADVSAGRYQDLTSDDKFGENADIDGAAEDIWDGGADWVPPTEARVHAIVSTDNTQDKPAGTGALTVRVYGLDASFLEVTDDIILNGTTPVNTPKSYLMIYRLEVLTAGSGGSNVGDITATAAVDGTVTAKILIGNNQTLMAIYQVPASKTLLLRNIYAYMTKKVAAIAQVRLWVKPLGSVWQLKKTFTLNATGSTFVDLDYAHKAIAEKSLIKISADTDTANTGVGAGFNFKLQS